MVDEEAWANEEAYILSIPSLYDEGIPKMVLISDINKFNFIRDLVRLGWAGRTYL